MALMQHGGLSALAPQGGGRRAEGGGGRGGGEQHVSREQLVFSFTAALGRRGGGRLSAD